MQPDPCADRKTGSVTELIAWLSLCMLAAAWATTLDPYWGRWWAIFGAFGLTSAVGLDVLNRVHARRKRKAREKRTTLRAERNLGQVIDDVHASGAIRAAVRQVKQHARNAESQHGTRHADARLPLDKPVTITRLGRRLQVAGDRPLDSFTGHVRNISRHGVGLALDRPLERGLVLLAFELDGGEPIHFIADVLWCDARDHGGYYSGGKLVDVISSTDARSLVAGQAE